MGERYTNTYTNTTPKIARRTDVPVMRLYCSSSIPNISSPSSFSTNGSSPASIIALATLKALERSAMAPKESPLTARAVAEFA